MILAGPEGRTTQWEDIQRKLGNLPPKAPVQKPDPWTPEKEEGKDKAALDSKTVEELQEAEDDYDDDTFLEQYRCAHLGTPNRLFQGCFSLKSLEKSEDRL